MKHNNATATDFSPLIALYNARKYADLESQVRTFLATSPSTPFAWQLLGGTLQMQGKDALAAFQKVTELSPNDAEAHFNLGVTLKSAGRLEQAANSYRHALTLRPNYVEALSNLGNVLQDLKQFEEATHYYRQALAIQPNSANTHNNLGTALKELGQFDAAILSYQTAISIQPKFSQAYSNLGSAFKELNKVNEALLCYKRIVEINPNLAEAHSNLGLVLYELKQFDRAITSCQRAIILNPNYAGAYNNLGLSFKAIGQLGSATTAYQRAIECDHNCASAYNNLGNILKDRGCYKEALINYQHALLIQPNFPEAHNNLGFAQTDLGLFEEATASFRSALRINPNYAEAHSNLLFCLNHVETIDAQTLFTEHLRFAEQFEAPLRAHWIPHANSRDPERCLQIGFVSGDLCNHAVASFLEPVLAELAKHPQLTLHAYYNHFIEDSVTQRLRGYFKHWHPIAALTDEALAQTIRADGIDILYDLAGHTAKNRLLTFARKPAPVQVSWIGYPGTTGLTAMDYYQSDRFLFPGTRFDNQFTEKIVRLPASSAFSPDKNAPPVNALPALTNGYLTFGSFNRLSKISRSVVALWSQLLRVLPNARMLLGAMPSDGQYQMLIEWFAQEGIAQERLIFHVRGSMEAYLGLHHQVDICLDTFPYGGGTTTFHALWMGVPTLTLGGQTMPSWVGISILNHVNLESFAAHSPNDFGQKGVYWANHLSELSNVRSELRERFANSARGQPIVVASAMKRALRIMWQRWCASSPVEALEVNWQKTDNLMSTLKE